MVTRRDRCKISTWNNVGNYYEQLQCTSILFHVIVENQIYDRSRWLDSATNDADQALIEFMSHHPRWTTGRRRMPQIVEVHGVHSIRR
jgi:hypothetical protein